MTITTFWRDDPDHTTGVGKDNLHAYGAIVRDAAVAKTAVEIADPASDTRVAGDAVYAKARLAPVDALETWGHSYLAGVGVGVTVGVDDMATLLAGMLRLPLCQQAVGGTALHNYLSAASNWTNILQEVTRPARFAARTGLIVSMYGMNDLFVLGAFTLPAMQPFLMAQRVAISRWRAARIFENTDATVVLGGAGSWASAAGVHNSGSDVAYNVTSGATITITTPADFPGGTIALGFMAWTDGGGATISGTVNGTVYSIDTSDTSIAANKSASVLRIPNVPAGSAAYVFTSTDPVGGVGAMFDYWSWEPAEELCPLVVLVKQPHPVDYTAYGEGAPTDASVDIMNAAFDTLAAEFGSQVITVDTSELDNSATYFSAGNVHPNVAGHLRLAELIRDAIKALVTASYVPAPEPYAWVTYAPTLTGTDTALGDGVASGAYQEIGKTVNFWARIVLGSTSAMGSTVELSLPTPKASDAAYASLTGTSTRTGFGTYPLVAVTGADQAHALMLNAAATALVTTTVPFTWVATDIIELRGAYQAA